MADTGITVGFDYSLTDLNTGRFYAPQAANEAIIFTRLGDPDLDGDWDALETDGLGGGIFIDTGVPVALSGRVEIMITDTAMDIFFDGVLGYSGSIIGALGDFPTGETLTSLIAQTGNDAGGIGSEENWDNFSVNMDPCGNDGSCTNPIGDVNLDGNVDLLDVGPFVDLLTSQTFQCEADVNEDGSLDLLDVTPFVEVLTGG